MPPLIFFVFALICVRNAFCFSCPSGQSYTFITVTNRELNEAPIARLPATSLEECLVKCVDVPSCVAVNFRRSEHRHDSPECRLLRNGTGRWFDSLIKSHLAMYHAEVVCLPMAQRPCNRTMWAFEMVPGIEMINTKLLIHEFNPSTREECLVACVKNEKCRAAMFLQNRCALSTISRHSVRGNTDDYFSPNREMEFYENNCFAEPNSQCHYLIRKTEGQTSIYDHQRTGVRRFEDCQKLCLAEYGFQCRSFTFDEKDGICYLSHHGAMMIKAFMGSEFLQTDENLTFGDVEDCVDMSLYCRQNYMEVKAQCRKLFTGRLDVKENPICSTDIIDRFEFDTKFQFDKCGMQKDGQGGTYSQLVMMKYSPQELITYRDRFLKLICRINRDQENLAVTFGFKVENRTNHEIHVVTATPWKPKFQLSVLDQSFRKTDSIGVGDPGYLEIQVVESGVPTDEAPVDFDLSSLTAVDDSNKNNELRLLDENGCLVNKDAIEKLESLGSGKMRVKVNHFAFQSSPKTLHYQALVKPCFKKQCEDRCNFVREKRISKRSLLFDPSVPKSYLFAEEQYELSTTVHLTKKNSSENSEQLSGAWRHCFLETYTCSITLMFLLIQCSLLVVCGIAVFQYFRLKRRRASATSLNASIYEDIQPVVRME